MPLTVRSWMLFCMSVASTAAAMDCGSPVLVNCGLTIAPNEREDPRLMSIIELLRPGVSERRSAVTLVFFWISCCVCSCCSMTESRFSAVVVSLVISDDNWFADDTEGEINEDKVSMKANFLLLENGMVALRICSIVAYPTSPLTGTDINSFSNADTELYNFGSILPEYEIASLAISFAL